MLPAAEGHRLLEQALSELAPDWQIAGPLTEVTVRDSDHWLSGIGTFGVTLRHRTTGAMKVLGRRAGAEPRATYHRGISCLVLEAYGERNTDPMRRYLQEIGALAPMTRVIRRLGAC